SAGISRMIPSVRARRSDSVGVANSELSAGEAIDIAAPSCPARRRKSRRETSSSSGGTGRLLTASLRLQGTANDRSERFGRQFLQLRVVELHHPLVHIEKIL